jgi:hypothetical protein
MAETTFTDAKVAVKSGNWSDPTVWSPTGVPGAGDDVTIAGNGGGFTVTNDLANAVCASLTLAQPGQPGGLYFLATSVLTVTSNVLVGSTTGTPADGSLTMTLGGIINIGGNVTINVHGSAGLVFDPGIGTVNFNGSSAQTIPALPYNNLTLSGSGTKTLTPTGIKNTSLSISGDLSIAPSGSTATAFLSGFSTPLPVGTLTLGGLVQSSSSYGGTGSGATHINTTYFNPAGANNYVNSATGGTPTSTTLASSQNPNIYGSNVTFTATVTPNTVVIGTPVNFFDSATLIGSGVLTGSVTKAASFTTNLLSVGSHSITATYIGDATFAPSTSTILTEVITKANTTNTVTFSANPSPTGSNVTLFSTLVPQFAGTPTGTVQFYTNNAAFGPLVSLSSLVASLTTNVLPHGIVSIKAFYPGDSNFNASSNTSSLLINASPTLTNTTISYTRNGGSSLRLTVTNVLVVAGVHDNDATDTNTITAVGTPGANGASTLLTGGYILYSPANAYSNANDSFTYTVTDTFGGTVTGTINVNVTNTVSPIFLTINAVSNGVVVSFNGIPNYSYVLQRSTTTTSSNAFSDIVTQAAAANGLWQFTTNTAVNPTYFRVRLKN